MSAAMPNAMLDPTSLRARAAQWVGLLGAPVLWLAELNAAYWLVPVACRMEQTLPVTLVSLAFLALTAGVGALAWGNWRRAGRAWPSSEAEDVPLERSRFMAVLGLMASGLFGLFILADLLPTLLIHPCLE